MAFEASFGVAGPIALAAGFEDMDAAGQSVELFQRALELAFFASLQQVVRQTGSGEEADAPTSLTSGKSQDRGPTLLELERYFGELIWSCKTEIGRARLIFPCRAPKEFP